MAEINIAFTVTYDWLEYSAVAAASILTNAGSDDFYCFYIISNNFDDETKEKFLLLDKIKKSNWNFILTNDNEYARISHNWLGSSSYYRLKLPSMINKDKVLYLDSDIIVLKDLAKFYNTDISEYYLAAVEDKDYGMRGIINENMEIAFHNSGVMLLNLKKFREDRLEEKMYKKLLKVDYSDQDVINIFCHKKILSMPLKYNLMHAFTDLEYSNRRSEYEQAIKEPVIIHFSMFKPWHGPCNISYIQEWHRYSDICQQLKEKYL